MPSQSRIGMQGLFELAPIDNRNQVVQIYGEIKDHNQF